MWKKEKVYQSNMQNLYTEFERMSGDTLGNIELTMKEIDRQFELETGLSQKEISLIFLATALQITRIWLVNNLTEIEKAGGKNKKEKKLHKIEKNMLSDFYDENRKQRGDLYYAPLNQIVTGRGVPYDATKYLEESHKLFKGANHRFSTLGHDPVLGLVFGTANILTNTITCVNLPCVTTNHVIYDWDFKNPSIAGFASTVTMFEKCSKRLQDEKEAVIAAVIKQVVHIGTDLYTPCGIQLPGANLLLDKATVEKITKVVSTGDVLKYGASRGISDVIDSIITVVHACMYWKDKMFSVKNRKILDISNTIATGSNVLCVAAESVAGVTTGNHQMCMDAIKKLDIAGIIKLTERLIKDQKFNEEIKREYFREHWKAHLQGRK